MSELVGGWVVGWVDGGMAALRGWLVGCLASWLAVWLAGWMDGCVGVGAAVVFLRWEGREKRVRRPVGQKSRPPRTRPRPRAVAAAAAKAAARAAPGRITTTSWGVCGACCNSPDRDLCSAGVKMVPPMTCMYRDGHHVAPACRSVTPLAFMFTAPACREADSRFHRVTRQLVFHVSWGAPL